MAFSSSTIRCHLDSDLDSALFDYQERLGSQLSLARAAIEDIRVLAARVSSDFSGPILGSMDAMLASSGSSTDTLIALTSLVSGDTAEDREYSIGDRFGMTVVGGRLVLPGTLDLSTIQLLSALVGGFDALLTLVPDIAAGPSYDVFPTDDSPPIAFVSRFIVVTTYMRHTVVAATSCAAEVDTEEEITIGIDIPVSAAAASMGIPTSEAHVYIFWLGIPSASDVTRRRARMMGLSNTQFVNAVAKTSSELFTVLVIPDPYDITSVASTFGPEADTVLIRVSGPITISPSADDIASFIRSALRSSSPGSAGPSGLPDFSSPGVALFSTMDINKTFGMDNVVDSISASGGDDLTARQYAEAQGAMLQSQMAVLSTIVLEAQAVVANILNEITNTVSLANMMFNEMNNGLMDCVLGAAFAASLGGFATPSVGGSLGSPGSPGTSGTSDFNPMEGILSALEGQSGLITDFFSSVSTLLGIVSDVSCGSSFAGSASWSPPASFGSPIPCPNTGFSVPEAITAPLGIAKVVMDVLTSMFDTIRTTLRALRTTVSSMNLSLRLSVERRNSSTSSFLPSSLGSPGCAPPEAVRLAALLIQRAIAGFSPPI